MCARAGVQVGVEGDWRLIIGLRLNAADCSEGSVTCEPLRELRQRERERERERGGGGGGGGGGGDEIRQNSVLSRVIDR